MREQKWQRVLVFIEKGTLLATLVTKHITRYLLSAYIQKGAKVHNTIQRERIRYRVCWYFFLNILLASFVMSTWEIVKDSLINLHAIRWWNHFQKSAGKQVQLVTPTTSNEI